MPAVASRTLAITGPSYSDASSCDIVVLLRSKEPREAELLDDDVIPVVSDAASAAAAATGVEMEEHTRDEMFVSNHPEADYFLLRDDDLYDEG